MCLTLLYTGMRISEALDAKLRHLNLNTENPSLYLPETENSEARSVYLPPIVVDALRQCRLGHFGRRRRHVANRCWCTFPQARSRCQAVPVSSRQLLGQDACEGDGGCWSLVPAALSRLHLFCHTYASWMVGINKMDNYALARTGRWKDPRSTAGYFYPRLAEAIQAANLPVPGRATIWGKSGEKRKTPMQVIEHPNK